MCSSLRISSHLPAVFKWRRRETLKMKNFKLEWAIHKFDNQKNNRFYQNVNSWPTFSPYLYYRVYSELTCHNSLSDSRLTCSLVHTIRLDWRPCKREINTHYSTHRRECEQCSQPQRSWIKLVRPRLQWNTLATLVYSTVDSGLTKHNRFLKKKQH